MKNKELFQIEALFNEIKGMRSNIKFSYGITKNMNIIENELNSLKAVLEPDQDFINFETDRIRLCEEFADKDENGKPIPENDRYKISNIDGFTKEFDLLKEKHKSAIINHTNKITEINKLLEEEVNLEFHKIPLSALPDWLSPEQIQLIMPMIDPNN